MPNGALREAWIWGPSGADMFDNSALDAARGSAYRGARSYCHDVPGLYMFRVTFDSNA
jgi:outer membrane biosynthesis protein TonB